MIRPSAAVCHFGLFGWMVVGLSVVEATAAAVGCTPLVRLDEGIGKICMIAGNFAQQGPQLKYLWSRSGPAGCAGLSLSSSTNSRYSLLPHIACLSMQEMLVISRHSATLVPEGPGACSSEYQKHKRMNCRNPALEAGPNSIRNRTDQLFSDRVLKACVLHWLSVPATSATSIDGMPAMFSSCCTMPMGGCVTNPITTW